MWKSAPFRTKANFEPLFISLQNDIRFFHVPIPALSTVLLTVNLPIWQKYGLTMFHLNNNGSLGSILYSDSHYVRVFPNLERNIRLYTFWFKPISYFGLFRFNEAYDSSFSLTILPKSCTLTAL